MDTVGLGCCGTL